ncbi:putative inactive peptidyl-prolyl cis-trans isomerase-like 6 [Lamellibrachia satsuma]|nr:putative inactive peptidyl-prolyl cis-trans isomerase-like 6 [Lamellibrachia satsuma]
MASDGLVTVYVTGMLSDVAYHMAELCAQDLSRKFPEVFTTPKCSRLLEFQWNLFLETKRRELRGDMWQFNESTLVYVDDLLIGGPKEFIQWAEEEHGYENFRPVALYTTIAEQEYKNFLNNKRHDYVYMDVAIGGAPAGRLVIELFSHVVPRTCNNFRALCTGERGESKETEFRLCYEGSMFHRVVKNGWIQGGDIWMKKGDGGESVYGKVFEDENFAVPHNKRGIVGMANKGRHTNASQFYITLQECKWMNTKYVAFGQVLEGTATLKAMEEQTTINDRPLKEISITACGILKFQF